jgi:3-methyladenine DNA glycosylase/8-oxoguanine DNA glycosylase
LACEHYTISGDEVQWGLLPQLDPSWSDLIDATWAGRPDPARQVREPADPEAFERILRFIEYVMDQSQRYI